MDYILLGLVPTCDRRDVQWVSMAVVTCGGGSRVISILAHYQQDQGRGQEQVTNPACTGFRFDTSSLHISIFRRA